MARERLKKAAKLTSEGSKDFYDEIAAVLYRYVADKSAASPLGTDFLEHLCPPGGAFRSRRAETGIPGGSRHL